MIVSIGNTFLMFLGRKVVNYYWNEQEKCKKSEKTRHQAALNQRSSFQTGSS